MSKIDAIIIKSQKELYYIYDGKKIYMAKARGVFREKKVKPLVGDYVIADLLDDGKAYIDLIKDRKSQIIRPPVANVDQVLLVLSLVQPKINYNITDKYLIMLDHLGINVAIALNKADLLSNEQIEEFKYIYGKSGYKIFVISNKNKLGHDDLFNYLHGKVTGLAGPSGVGKSSLLNCLQKENIVETGSVSEKTKRGKHTTRHSEIFPLGSNTYILDTPGFSSLNLSFIEDPNMLRQYYREFIDEQKKCRFSNCQHINEPQCRIKELVNCGLISKNRYDNYLFLRDEIIKERKY